MRALPAALLFVLAGCAHGRVEDPSAGARRLARETADALDRGDVAAVTARITATTTPPGVDRSSLFSTAKAELAAAAARLRAAAAGRATQRGSIRLAGALGVGVRLDREPEGWRVDPESFGAAVASPAAAVQALITALERMETDPALALLTQSLRASIVGASRERIGGLRAMLPALEGASAGRLSLQLDYGQGLFVALRLEGGAWRIDDFN